MTKKITLILAGIFLSVIVLGLTLPSSYEISRSVTIDSPVDDVHAYLNNIEQWPRWAPWHNTENEVSIRRGKISTGVGASQTWSGEGGTGSLEITQSSLQSGIEYVLHFGKEEQDTVGNFKYQPNGEQTIVTWTMTGEMSMPIIGPYAVLIMDSMAGPTLLTGLDKLKAAVEWKPEKKVTAE